MHAQPGLRDALVASSGAIRLGLDFRANGIEVGILAFALVQKHAVLLRSLGRVDELEDKWSARHDARAARQKVLPIGLREIICRRKAS